MTRTRLNRTQSAPNLSSTTTTKQTTTTSTTRTPNAPRARAATDKPGVTSKVAGAAPGAAGFGVSSAGTFVQGAQDVGHTVQNGVSQGVSTGANIADATINTGASVTDAEAFLTSMKEMQAEDRKTQLELAKEAVKTEHMRAFTKEMKEIAKDATEASGK